MQNIKYLVGLISLFAILLSPPTYALTESGTIIKNQAAATYRDSNDLVRRTSSNIVETVVQPVVSVTISEDQNKLAAPSKEVRFNHIITNTGNNDESFILELSSPLPSLLDSMRIFPDEDYNGIEDVLSPEIPAGGVIGPLAPGESYYIVLVGSVSSTATNGSTAFVTFSATSQTYDNDNSTTVFSGGNSSDSNTDTVEVTDGPIIEITKSLSKNEGASPSGPYVMTLTYSNVGLTDMVIDFTAGIQITDVLPEGMRYNGNLNWSLWGINNGQIVVSGVTQSVAVSQPVAGTTSSLAFNLETCIAGDPLCLTQDELKFELDGLDANEHATISFEVMIEGELPALELVSQASFGYDENNVGVLQSADIDKYRTNATIFSVNPRHDVVINTGGCILNLNCVASDDASYSYQQYVSAPQGGQRMFTQFVWNLGNDEDVFNLELTDSTYPVGTSFMLYTGSGVTPLRDNNGDGILDTGVVPGIGSSCPSHLVTATTGECGTKITLIAYLPVEVSGGGSYSVRVNATSASQIDQTDYVTNVLQTIEASTVDITVNYRAETLSTTEDNCDNVADRCGYALGPESTPVVTNIANPSKSTTFTLFVTNTSGIADAYVLDFSNVASPFTEDIVSTGFSVQYTDTDGNPITNTFLVLPDESVEIRVVVTVDKSVGISTENLYFKVSSPSTNAEDTLFTAVSVELITPVVPNTSNQCIVIGSPNQAGTVRQGGRVIYKHVIDNNTGNSYNGVSFSVLDSKPGFASILYIDSNDNGEFDIGDTKVDAPIDFSPQSKLTIFIQVLSAKYVPINTINNTTISATVSCGNIIVIDSTTTANVSMQIVKEQAKDTNCDGSIDIGSAYSVNPFDVAPGECILYRLTAENLAIEDAREVVLTDITPSFTSFRVVSGIPSINIGTINSISDGSVGVIIGSVGVVSPGEVVEMIFAVKVDD